MRRYFPPLMAVIATCASGCIGSTTHYGHLHENPYRKGLTLNPRFATSCAAVACSRVVYVNGDCLVTDGTNVLSEIDVLVGTRLCIYNQSGCELTLKFDATLFGNSVYTVPADGCVNLTVKPAARNQHYVSDFACCQAGGHTNPDVKVGGDEEH